MSRLARRIAPLLTAALTSPRTRRLRRGAAEWRRRLGGAPHRVAYFHQVDDPHSQLAAQVLSQFLERYDVALAPHLVGPPSDAAAPERERLAAFARKDAADVAPYYGLAFPPGAAAPPPEDTQRAGRALAAALAAGGFAEQAPRVGAALWGRDSAALEPLAAGGGAEDSALAAAVAAGDAKRRRLGHYLGATFHYAGEWYWGVDRLHHLERRLTALGLRRPETGSGPLIPRPRPEREPAPRASERLTLEFYPSLRSPYTAIAMERSLELPRRLPVELVLRPVLPMVMRGLPVPPEKRRYIVLDAKREAEDAGVPFGRICDPVGRPVERAFSLWRLAREHGRAGELLASFTRAAFAEGIDTGTDAGLRRVVLHAGLDWDEARARLSRDDGWRDELEANRRALLAAGLWGVPSYRLLGRDGEPDFCTWGQDRLWLVESEIRRRLR